MNGLNLTRRLKRLEKRLRPSAASTFTLEDSAALFGEMTSARSANLRGNAILDC